MNKTCIDTIQCTSTRASPTSNELEQLTRYMYMIIYPIIFLFGIIGNVLSSLLFSTTELGQTSCAVYFLLLAISDSIALIGGLHHCLTLGYRFHVLNAAYCRIRNFLVYASMDMASWMVVAISVDRFYKVKYPLQARITCTRKTTIIVSCIIGFILILKNVHLSTHFIGDFTPNADDNCDPNPDYPTYVSFFKNIWPWIDLATFALIPFVIITTCNIFIIYNTHKRGVKFGHRSMDRSLIKFLLISSISFIICNFPVTITLVIYPYISPNYSEKQHYDEVTFAFDFLRLPSYASLAFNFYIYYYSSSLYRQQAIFLFHRIFRNQTKSEQTQIQMGVSVRIQNERQVKPKDEIEEH